MEHTRFSEPLNMENTKFHAEVDAEHAKVEGKSFIKYLLNVKQNN